MEEKTQMRGWYAEKFILERNNLASWKLFRQVFIKPQKSLWFSGQEEEIVLGQMKKTNSNRIEIIPEI